MNTSVLNASDTDTPSVEAFSDMLYFERRLTEIIEHMQPKAKKWRTALVLSFLFTAYSAYFWIVDPSISTVTFRESLMNHPLFVTNIVVLLVLFLVFGIHKRVVSPKISFSEVLEKQLLEATTTFQSERSTLNNSDIFLVKNHNNGSEESAFIITNSSKLPHSAFESIINENERRLTKPSAINISYNGTKMMVIDEKSMDLVPLEELPGMFLLVFGVAFMVIGGAIPYVFQYIEIYQRKSAVGFSLLVCLALCVANILRILFWFGEHFETPLLVQSVVMIACMILMLEISVRMNKKLVPPVQRMSVWRGDFLGAFWKWNDLSSYIFTLILITCAASAVTLIFHTNKLFVNALGMTALLVEACLGLPQLIRNFQRRSVSGMSVKMVLMWLIGDVGKTVYFLVRHSPAQFPICSCLQITIDILILLQVFFYGNMASNSRVPTFSAAANPRV